MDYKKQCLDWINTNIDEKTHFYMDVMKISNFSFDEGEYSFLSTLTETNKHTAHSVDELYNILVGLAKYIGKQHGISRFIWECMNNAE